LDFDALEDMAIKLKIGMIHQQGKQIIIIMSFTQNPPSRSFAIHSMVPNMLCLGFWTQILGAVGFQKLAVRDILKREKDGIPKHITPLHALKSLPSSLKLSSTPPCLPLDTLILPLQPSTQGGWRNGSVLVLGLLKHQLITKGWGFEVRLNSSPSNTSTLY